jgi:hypothetical protein
MEQSEGTLADSDLAAGMDDVRGVSARLTCGIATVAELAAAPGDLDPVPLGDNPDDVLRHQAVSRVDARETMRPRRRHLPPVAGMGYTRLRDPIAGHVFFDLEGDPMSARTAGSSAPIGDTEMLTRALGPRRRLGDSSACSSPPP